LEPHGHAKADARHLHLHRVALAKLRAHPELCDSIVDLIDRWLADDPSHPSAEWLQEWRVMLTSWPFERLVERVLDEDGGQVLRQTSPLAGVLTARERWAALDEVNRRLATARAPAKSRP
jgi:hypothetical protein